MQMAGGVEGSRNRLVSGVCACGGEGGGRGPPTCTRTTQSTTVNQGGPNTFVCVTHTAHVLHRSTGAQWDTQGHPYRKGTGAALPHGHGTPLLNLASSANVHGQGDTSHLTAHMHTRPARMHTHTRTRTHAQARTHAHTRTRTHNSNPLPPRPPPTPPSLQAPRLAKAMARAASRLRASCSCLPSACLRGAWACSGPA